MADTASRSTLIIGIDGLGPILLTRLVEKGVMPHLRRLAERGQRYRIPTTVPEDPVVLWSDFATGHRALDHGVLATVKPTAGGIARVTNDDWRVPPVWLRVAQAGRRVAVINWPASSPGSTDLPGLSVTSDLEINDEPSNTTGRNDRRLDVRDIPAEMVQALAGPHEKAIAGLAPDDPRRLALAAALARAGTIQNAAIDAIEEGDALPDLLMVRYDLTEVLARMALPRPGLLDRGGIEEPDAVGLAIIDGGAMLIDSMVGELIKRLPDDTAVLVVGLLDYKIPATEEQPPEADIIVAEEPGGMDIWAQQRRFSACRHGGGYALWLDPASALPAAQRATNCSIQQLLGAVLSRYKLDPIPYPGKAYARELVGLNNKTQGIDDRFRLGLANPVNTNESNWESVLQHRALNLARSASEAQRWHFAVHAWDLVLSRRDRFVFHMMRMEALLHAKRFERLDEELKTWLTRVPANTELRLLASVRKRVQDPPPPELPRSDQPSPLSTAPDREEVRRYGVCPWSCLEPSGWATITKRCEPSVRACHQAYALFARLWDSFAAEPVADDRNAGTSRQHPDDPLLNRHALSLAANNSFSDRHASSIERGNTLAQHLARLARQKDLAPLTEPWLKQLHRELYVDPDAIAMSGGFRTHKLDTGLNMPRIDGSLIKAGPMPDPEDDIPELTRRSLAATRAQLDAGTLDPLCIATIGFISILKIHPFSDGNGRTSRALLIHILQQNGFPLIGHVQVQDMLERHREPYLAHCASTPQARQQWLKAPPEPLILENIWLIDLITQCIEGASEAVKRLIEEQQHEVSRRSHSRQDAATESNG